MGLFCLPIKKRDRSDAGYVDREGDAGGLEEKV